MIQASPGDLLTNVPSAPPKRRRFSLTSQILVGLLAGIVLGVGIRHWAEPEDAIRYSQWIEPFSELFVRLVKMIIAPIIFSSLVAGVAGAGHYKTVGRMGVRALIYFEVVTSFALVLGLLAVNLVRPGDGVPLPEGDVSVQAPAATLGWADAMLHTVPTSVVKAMAEGDVLQLVVFSILFAVALGTLGPRAQPVILLCEVIAEASFKLTNIIMHYAPIGVGAAVSFTIIRSGVEVLLNLASLILTLYATLVLFVLLVLVPAALMFGVPLRKFFRVVREPAVIAFSTTSSEAALPRAMEGLELLGVPRRIVSFILPLGYSFNLDGTTLYMSLAAVFVAQVAHVELTVSQQIMILLTLMLTSKGVAAVPRASYLILSATLASFGIPLQGLALILGVDALMDMARTMVNVIGNCLATVIIAKWEGEFKEASDAELDRAAQEDEI